MARRRNTRKGTESLATSCVTLQKNLPGGPKVSRGTSNTTKIIKIKIYTR